MSAAEARRTLHELEVHRAELEIQNEELRAARAENEAALARYTELFDFAPIGYATLGVDGVIRALNHAGARILGKAPARAIGMSFQTFVAPSAVRECHAFLSLAAESDIPVSRELSLSIGRRLVQVRLTASAASGGDTILVAFDDITEQLAHQAQLALTEQALREVDRRKDEFLAMLSHELRNPLGPIRTSLFILDRVDPASSQALAARAIIERQAMHLTRLVDDLLDVTRITRGKVALQCESVELAELVRRTIDDHRSAFEALGIHLVVRIAPGAFWLQADAARLIQIVSNVLGNAEKFTPRDGTVTVVLESTGGAAVLRVRDTGVGIDPEVIPSLFEPFAQAPQTIERSRGGLGLGLAMVRGLTELHGGSVEISSEGTGCGTEVVIRLPLAERVRQVVPAVAAPDAGARRVLVIEDNPDAASTLREALRLLGHEVAVAAEGASGLDLARMFRPEVVICDLGLPGMDGYAVAGALRADPVLRDVTLIALSGYARPEDRQRTAAGGFDHHVAKPPDVEELRRLLDEAGGADRSLAVACSA